MITLPPAPVLGAAGHHAPARNGHPIWLFAGSDAGGRQTAAVASLVATARLNGLDPEAYLCHVLGVIADHPVSRVAELLPWNLEYPR